MKLSSILKICAASAAIVCLAACEWGAGDDADSWSDSFNWVNFSGAYRSYKNATAETAADVKETGSETITTTAGGKYIYTIVQSGQNITFTDGRSGAIYKGKFTSLRSASGYENTQAIASGAQDGVKTSDTKHALPPPGDTIIGSFEAKGSGGRWVGTLQGTVYDTNGDNVGDVFANRTLTATFVGARSTVQVDAACQANVAIAGGSAP